jgi:hypothetical protein
MPVPSSVKAFLAEVQKQAAEKDAVKKTIDAVAALQASVKKAAAEIKTNGKAISDAEE